LATGAFTFMLELCRSLSLVPDLLAACALKLGARGETYDTQPQHRSREPFAAGVVALATGAITI
jgi:arginine:ornithine antiporter/lysine permease